MMDSLPINQRDPVLHAKAGRRRQFGVALAQLALTIALILSIVVVLAVAGASGALAQARTDLMVMEESTTLSTALIVGVIALVMGFLTILAIRDASPARRSAPRRTAPRR
jgi:ABC-type sulfate transport system permease component